MNIKITTKKEGSLDDEEVKTYCDIWKLRDDEKNSITLIRHNHECTYINKQKISKIEVEA